MRVLVCGGRDYPDKDEVWKALDVMLRGARHDTLVVIQGGGSGADRWAREWCAARRVPYDNYPADWAKHGRAAGPIRNQRMIDEGRPNLVLAFPGGRGTADMIQRAQASGVRVKAQHEIVRAP